VLSRANRKLTETIGLIQTYTELAFPKALEGNATLNALLYGNQRLIGERYVRMNATQRGTGENTKDDTGESEGPAEPAAPPFSPAGPRLSTYARTPT
jgi:hypothetical protein